MGLDALAYMGWREAIVALAAVLTIYVVVVFLRINRLRRERQAQPASAASRAAVAAYAEGQHPFFAPPYLGPEPVETNAARTELDEPAPEPPSALGLRERRRRRGLVAPVSALAPSLRDAPPCSARSPEDFWPGRGEAPLGLPSPWPERERPWEPLALCAFPWPP